MDISTKYRKVQSWLENLYAGQPVPKFERNERTIDLLHQLMLKNVTRDRDTQLIIQDLRQRATEYAAEGQRLGNVLGRMNLSAGSLSQSGVMSLRTLSNLAWLLQTRDTTDTSYLLGLTSLQNEADKVHEDFLAEEQLLTQLTLKTKDAVIKHGAILKTCQDLETQSTQHESKTEKQVKDTSFLRGKIQQYDKQMAKLKNMLSRSGVDSSLFHENLVKKAQALQKLEEELEQSKKKLQDFHDLPVDISQAKVKLVELRREVGLMESQLSRKIDAMKL